MNEVTQLSVPGRAEKIFNFFLLLYPETYRKQYASEMRLLFYEMYQEEVASNGKVRLEFWFSQVSDMTKSVIEQHVNDIGKKGMKKYLQQTLHINRYNVIGLILLSPALAVFAIDLVARIVQGDFSHYNRPVYNFLSHTPLYWYPVLFSWVILFPMLAVVVNIIPFLTKKREKSLPFFSAAFLRKNVIALLVMGIGLFFIAIVKLHDFAPCMIHGLLKVGFGQFNHIITVCRKA